MEESPKWIKPENRKKAAQRAKDKVRQTIWRADIIVSLSSILVVALVLSLKRVSYWGIGVVVILGLAMTWFIVWMRVKKQCKEILDDELARCPDEWKDYYHILRISRIADSKAITGAYEKLNHPLSESLSEEAQQIPLYSQMLSEIKEAYQVLSNAKNRTKYDQIYWARYNAGNTEIEEATKRELIALSQSFTRRVSEVREWIDWKIPFLSKIPRPALSGVLAVGCSVLIGGTSLAFAKPEDRLATPFVGIAATLTEVSASPILLVEDIRGVAAIYERSVISMALQSMRIDKDLGRIPEVRVATNDMAYFPSREHPLFPDYTDRRVSMFRYTVDEKGIVSVDTSWAVADTYLDRIERTLARLGKRE